MKSIDPSNTPEAQSEITQERTADLYSDVDLERINRVLQQPNFVNERKPFKMRYVFGILFGTGISLGLMSWLAANVLL